MWHVLSLFLGVAGRINRVLRRQVVTHPRSQLPHWGYARNFARHQPQNSPLLLLNTIDMSWLAGSTSTAFATMNSCATVSWMCANRICAPCRGNRSRMRQGCLPGRLFTLHRSCLAIKWPGGAWLFLSGTPHRWYQTTCYHFNIFQRQSPWVLLGAHKIQECFHVLGQLSSTVTAVLYNMRQVSNTFAWARSI